MIALKKSAKSADFFIVFRLTNILLIYASLCGLPHLLLCHLLCHFFIKLYQFAIIYDNFLLYAFLSMPHKYWIFRLFLHQNRHATIKSINSCLYCSMYSYPPYLNRFPGFFFFSSVFFLASFFRLQKAKRTFTSRFRHLLKTMHRYKLVYYVNVNFSTDKTEFYRVFFHLFIRVFHILFPYL